MSSTPFTSEKTDYRAPAFAPTPPQCQNDWILLGESSAVRQLRSQIQRIAPYFRTALIRGETGTGKEFVARAIHALSPGADGPFIVADAAELAESLAVGEGASPLESARGGTLYLRGVGGLSFDLRAALCNFIRACEKRPNPSYRDRLDRRRSEIRILAESNRDLGTLSATGQFRQELCDSLTAVEIFLPALRERLEDIPELCDGLLRRFADQTGQSLKLLADSTVVQLQRRIWSNNLRELSEVVQLAAALAEGAIIEPRHLPAFIAPPPLGPANRTARLYRLHDVVQRHVHEVLTRCDGNKLRAAELLGISRSTLYRMLGETQ
jgi:DNA-binding NtrC family response regulator